MAFFRRRSADQPPPASAPPAGAPPEGVTPAGSAPAWAPEQDPHLDQSGIVGQIVAQAVQQRDAAIAAADAQYGFAQMEQWSYDLGRGTIRFVVPGAVWVGRIQVLGTWNRGAESWMWGWANAAIDDALTTASFGVHETAKRMGIEQLQRGTLRADAVEAAQLASLAFQFAESPYFFVAPTDPVTFVAVADLQPGQ